MSNILLVDDDVLILELMQDALSDTGHDVQIAENGKEAIKLIDKGPFDFVITDILMPEIDGLELIDYVIDHCPTAGILAISGGGPGKDGGDLLDSALSSGADAILQKPFKPDDLVRTAIALMR